MSTRFFANADENTLSRKLQGIFESNKAIECFARDFFRANRRSNIHLYPDNWKKLLVPDVLPERQTPIVSLVDQMLNAKQRNSKADITELEVEADLLVRELYGLTAEKIALAKGKA
jgi:hypothetical protein